MREILWVFCRSIYHLATLALGHKARGAEVYKGEKFSDHAPLTVEYDFSL